MCAFSAQAHNNAEQKNHTQTRTRISHRRERRTDDKAFARSGVRATLDFVGSISSTFKSCNTKATQYSQLFFVAFYRSCCCWNWFLNEPICKNKKKQIKRDAVCVLIIGPVCELPFQNLPISMRLKPAGKKKLKNQPTQKLHTVLCAWRETARNKQRNKIF